MAYEVLVDPKVVEDLDEIVGYISNELGSPQAALNILDAFDELVGRLEHMPLSYPLSHDKRLSSLGSRRALVGRYLVLFRVREDDGAAGTVWISYIFHEAQDYQRLV